LKKGLKRADARNPRAIIPSHSRGDKYLHEIHSYSFQLPLEGVKTSNEFSKVLINQKRARKLVNCWFQRGFNVAGNETLLRLFTAGPGERRAVRCEQPLEHLDLPGGEITPSFSN
jgi:hypothetical protein